MKSPIPNTYYFTWSKNNLFDSLKRYFKYVLETDIVDYTDKFNKDNKVTILIHNEEKNSNTLQKLFEHSKYNFVTLGYGDKNSLINLLDFTSLKEEINKYIFSDEDNVFPLYTKEELLKKVEPLFKDHGEVSLFEKLNYIHYNISNGVKLFLANELEMEEVKQEFLLNAIKLWDKFNERFQQHVQILELLNCEKDIELLENYIFSFDKFIELIKKNIKSDLIEIDEVLLYKNLEFLSKISEILQRIFTNLGFVSAPIQTINHR